MKNLILLLGIGLIGIGCKKTHQSNQEDEEYRVPVVTDSTTILAMKTTSESIAMANGFEHWKKVEKVKFTFNVDRDTTHFERSWVWMPKTDQVTLTTAKDTVTYLRNQIDTISEKTDRAFINDKFWLCTPFQLMWDAKSFTSHHQLKAIAPISGESMQKLTITYKKEGGYTPGDAYDLYFKGDFILREWSFRKGNEKEPSMSTTWEDYQNFNGIKIAKTHKKGQEDWKLYFTDVTIELE